MCREVREPQPNSTLKDTGDRAANVSEPVNLGHCGVCDLLLAASITCQLRHASLPAAQAPRAHWRRGAGDRHVHLAAALALPQSRTP